jgi:hypothetical protein
MVLILTIPQLIGALRCPSIIGTTIIILEEEETFLTTTPSRTTILAT